MSWTRRTAPVALAAAFALLSARDARADIHGWTLCTPSIFHSCHSVSIATTPIIAGNVRVGTGISVSVTNLQGSGYAFDNTTLSGLFRVLFTSRDLSQPMGFAVAPHFATMTGPGASGGAQWYYETGTSVGTQNTVRYVDNYPFSQDVIGGCASGAVLFGLYNTSANTCGFNASAVFSFNSGNIIDAGQFDDVFIEAFGPGDFDFCFADPNKAPDDGFAACDVQKEFVINATPEPVTIALLGTGLFGIGGVRLRRKRTPTA